jgi:hypothetical protein
MKKIMLPVAIAAIALVSCEKDISNPPARPVESATKTIHFSVAQVKDYSDPRYEGLKASLNITVGKISKKDASEVILWDTAIAQQSILDFPAPHRPSTFSKTFTGIKDADENVTVSYWIGYRDRFNQLKGEGKNEFAPNGNSNMNFHVRL